MSENDAYDMLNKALSEQSTNVKEKPMPETPAYRPLNEDDRLISLGKAADMLGVSVDSVRRYISEGYLPAYQLAGHTLRVRSQDVIAFAKPVPTNLNADNQENPHV